MKQTILVVDDDYYICELVKMYLEDEYNIEMVHNGTGVIDKVKNLCPVLILLDIMLPGKNGWEVCKDIRRELNIPIIMLTAKGEEIDKVLGLELGADDYITKPFSPREMAARVKAVLRRTKSSSEKTDKILVFPGIELNSESRIVAVNGELVDLTPKEFELLWVMAASNGKVFSREKLLDLIWGYDFLGDTRAVDSHVKRLRKKLESMPGAPIYIQTVWGIGYKFEV